MPTPKGKVGVSGKLGLPHADARISVQHGAVQVFEEDNSVGLAPALVLRQTPSAHDQVTFLPQDASPAVGFRLGALKRVDNGLLVVGDEGDQARRRLPAEFDSVPPYGEASSATPASGTRKERRGAGVDRDQEGASREQAAGVDWRRED